METAPDGLRPPTEADVAEAVRRLVLAFDPLRIDLFGSVACGTAGPGSDLDLLIVLPALDRTKKRAARVRARRVLEGIGTAVDVVVTTPDDIERSGDVVGFVLREALREGRTVYAP